MREKCVWIAGKVTKWPSNRGPISKIWQSDGCNGDTVPLAVRQWYNFHSGGCHLGNVGSESAWHPEIKIPSTVEHITGTIIFLNNFLLPIQSISP